MSQSPTRTRSRALRALIAAALLLAGLTGLIAVAGPSSARTLAGKSVVGGTDLGANVYVFTPDMAQSEIQNTVDTIANQQVSNQFGTQRYALLFAPGTYGSAADPLIFQVGYYTEVAGLGRNPGDVVINGSIDVYNQCDATNGCIALNNFWRTMTNLTINVTGQSGCQANTEFWAVSQASALRRVQVNGGMSLMDYCSNGPQYASGGYIADSGFTATVVNGSQQQFFVRNTNLGGWSNSVWNQVFVGDQGAPAEKFGTDTTYYTNVASTPASQEEPYLYLDSTNSLRVFVPHFDNDSSGTTWSATSSTPGSSLPISSFFIATPSSSVASINAALTAGKNLLITPGVYSITSPLMVKRSGTVVLGLGLPTLVSGTTSSELQVAGVPGVKISGLILDAGTRTSSGLLAMAASVNGEDKIAPSLVQDVYFRVGGASAGSTKTAAYIATSNVILDNVWAWRADHGAGVGWTKNTAPTGLWVSGADVTAYGLFVEHFQGDEISWVGANGSIYMLQNEMPYDVPSQAAWNTSSTIKGHAALTVSPRATGFAGYGLGSYSFFNQKIDIHATQAFTVPSGIGAHLHDSLTVFLNGSGGIDSVVDGVGSPVTSANSGTPSVVVDH